jgi:hypothetical protein
MEQIIKSLSEKLGLPESVVRTAAAAILNFVKQKAGGSQFEKFLELLPGADSLLSAAPAAPEGGGGLLGGILQAAGGLLGGSAGDAAKAAAAIQQAGVPADKVAPLAQGFFEQAGQIAGPDALNQLLESVPAIKALLGGK